MGNDATSPLHHGLATAATVAEALRCCGTPTPGPSIARPDSGDDQPNYLHYITIEPKIHVKSEEFFLFQY